MHVARVIGLWFRLMVLSQCVAGPILLVISLASVLYTEAFLHRCIATTGTVVQNVVVTQRHEDYSVTTNYAPVFRYIVDGRTYTVTSSNSANPPEFVAGQQVRVFYVRGAPDSAKIDSFLQLWTTPIVVAGLGLASCAVGYILLFVMRRRNMKIMPTLAHS